MRNAQSDHLPILDLIRWLSALAVVAYHLRDLIFRGDAQLSGASPWLHGFYLATGLGHQAVMVFFVLSGYLVGGALVYRPIGSPRQAAEYLVARFARVYPVLLPALAVTLLVGAVLSRWLHAAPIFAGIPWGESLGYDYRARLGAWPVLCNALNLQEAACEPLGNNGPLWSLSCEWFYYMSFPVALRVIASRPSFRSLAAAAGLAAIAATAFPVALQYYPVWLLGIAARLAGDRRPLGAWGLAGFSAAFLGSLAAARSGALPQLAGDLAVAASMAGLLTCHAVRALRLGPLHARLAGFSYSLYAIHFPVAAAVVGAWQEIEGLRHRIAPTPLAFLVFASALATCYLAAFFLAQATERQTGAIRRRLMERLRRSMAPRRPAPEAIPSGRRYI